MTNSKSRSFYTAGQWPLPRCTRDPESRLPRGHPPATGEQYAVVAFRYPQHWWVHPSTGQQRSVPRRIPL